MLSRIDFMDFFNSNLLTRFVFGTLYLGLLICAASFGLITGLFCFCLFILFVELCFAVLRSDAALHNRVIVGLSGIIYLVIPIYAIFHLDDLDLIFAFVYSSLVDTAAYISGRIIGGSKLTKISPNKTWSGAMGGIIIPVLIMQLFVVIKHGSRPNLGLLGYAIIAVIAQIGDIFVSYGKRRLCIKDSSNILPGHGGLWDRMDSVLAVVVALFLSKFIV